MSEMKQKNIPSNTKWEDVVGYSRAVRIGNIIEVSGTAPIDGENIIGRGRAYEQTRFIMQKISNALSEAGSSLNDVIRTRIFVTDILLFEEVASAHNEIFREIKPATSLIEIKSLVHPDLLVEIEATVVLSGQEKI